MEKTPLRIFLRIASLQAALLLLAITISALAARYYFKELVVDQGATRLRDTLRAVSPEYLAKPGPAWCKAHDSQPQLRFTIVTTGGQVVCDTRHSAAEMESHADRPEVRGALENGFATHVRRSATLGESLLYAALRVPESGTGSYIIRAAVPLSEVDRALEVFDASLAAVLVTLAIALVAFALWSGKTMVYGEWSEIEMSMDDIKKDLASKTATLDLERQELSTLMSAISDAVLSVDLQGAPLYFNSRFEVLFGTPGSRHIWELFRDPDVLGAFRTALEQGTVGTSHAVAVEIRGEAGRRFFSPSVSPLKKASGQIYGAIGIFHDVTELKAAEQMRIDFVANVSHELRTPLTSIKGYTDTVMDDVKTGRSIAPEYLDAIKRNVERLMGLIGDLLDLSTLESSELLTKTKISTEEVTARAIEQLRPHFANKDLAVSLEAETAYVLADPRRLEQVLVNLLDNARKYTPVGGGIKVSWTADDSNTYLRVIDTGPGIPPEHHARLFERFYRVDKARSRELGGTGLGLAIVKHIMQRHEGAIWVESAPGRGATFICRFPAGDHHYATETRSS